VRPFPVKVSEADWFLRDWNVSRRECSMDYIIQSVVFGSFTRGRLAHTTAKFSSVEQRATSTSVRFTDIKTKSDANCNSHCLIVQPKTMKRWVRPTSNPRSGEQLRPKSRRDAKPWRDFSRLKNEPRGHLTCHKMTACRVKDREEGGPTARHRKREVILKN